jgi:DNA helicase-2/ATP-dependent DNA helicase PcrA
MDALQTVAKANGASLWMTIRGVTDPEFPLDVAMTSRAKEAFRGFKAVIDGLIKKATDDGGNYSVSDVVIAAIEDTGYANALRAENTDEAQARLENLEELVNAAVDYDKQQENGLRDFIDHAALTSDTDRYDSSAGVTLMTIHMAKGL